MATHMSAALSKHGIDMATDSQVFWDLCAGLMVNDPDKAACTAIGAHLKATYFVLFVECMVRDPEEGGLTRSDMLDAIKAGGGNTKWLKQIEALLGHTFKSPESGATQMPAPVAEPSDCGRKTNSKPSAGADKENEGGGAKMKKERPKTLGEELEGSDKLKHLEVDEDALYAVCEETDDPLRETITKNDTKAVTYYIYNWVRAKYGRTNGGRKLFNHLGKKLKKLIPRYHSQSVKWALKLEYHFEARNRSNSTVRTHSP
jgi:hypothetical protein